MFVENKSHYKKKQNTTAIMQNMLGGGNKVTQCRNTSATDHLTQITWGCQ